MVVGCQMALAVMLVDSWSQSCWIKNFRFSHQVAYLILVKGRH